MFRIVHGMFHFPSAVFVRLDTCRFTRSSYHPSFVCPYARTCYYFNSFVPRTVRLWNTLPTPYSGVGSNRMLQGPPIQVVGVALITEFCDHNYSFVEVILKPGVQTFTNLGKSDI